MSGAIECWDIEVNNCESDNHTCENLARVSMRVSDSVTPHLVSLSHSVDPCSPLLLALSSQRSRQQHYQRHHSHASRLLWKLCEPLGSQESLAALVRSRMAFELGLLEFAGWTVGGRR